MVELEDVGEGRVVGGRTVEAVGLEGESASAIELGLDDIVPCWQIRIVVAR